MKNGKLKTWLSLLLCLVLLAAAALSVTCAAETAVREAPAEYVIPAAEGTDEIIISLTGTKEEPVVLGEGKTAFLFQVVDGDGNESWFEIHTDKTNLAEALLDEQLVAGSEGDYGLFVDTVCGLQVIWSEAEPFYWGLFENDEMAQTGVSSIEINPETVYAFKVTK